jgi:hypothetical protein
LSLFLNRRRSQKEWMLAKFLDVTQNKESILNCAVFNQLLKSLIFEHKLINLLLNVCER